MNYKNAMFVSGTEFEGWTRELDGSLRLWPMESFACRVIGDQIPVVRIDYLRPPGHAERTGKLQIHLSPQQARMLSAALLHVVGELEKAAG